MTTPRRGPRSAAGRTEATLADVAAAAGVSIATASRALHPAAGRTVRPELAERVRAAAAELRYVANEAARATARGRSDTIALIVHDIADPFTAAVTAGVVEQVRDHDLIVTVAATGGDPEVELRHLEQFRRQRARAVILAGSRSTDTAAAAALAAEVTAFAAAGGRVVAIGRPVPGIDTVVLDEAGAAARLAGLLCALGHRRFAVLAGPENLESSEQRLAGFRAGAAAHGGEVPDEWVLSTQSSRDGGYVGMRELLDQGLDIDAVDAVFAAADVMAIGAMAALTEHGYRVPRDVAMAGFDDVPMLRDIRPGLTTVKLPSARIARLATEIVLGDHDGPPGSGSVTVPVELVVRDSTPDRRADRPG